MRDYSNLTPVIVPTATTLGDLKDLARHNGWTCYRYDARRGVLYAETGDATPPLLRDDDERLEMIVRRIDEELSREQAG